MNKGRIIFKCVLAAILFLLLFGLLTMVLWNWLIPSLFNGPHIRFIEALGLLLLGKILFSGWGGRRRCGNGGGTHWKHRYYEKLSSMSAEDRERFKARMREKWCTTTGKPGAGEKSDNSNV